MIKKALFILICVVLATTSFAQKGKYTIKATVDDPTLNGITAYLQIHHPGGIIELDSCVVSKGNFSFNGEVEGNTTADIVFHEYNQATPFFFGFILEPGTLYIDHFHKYDDDVTLKGTPLNDALNAYLQVDRADPLSHILRKAYGDDPIPTGTFQADTVLMEQTLWIYIKNEIMLPPAPEQKRYAAKQDSLFLLAQKHRVQRLWNLYHQNERNLLACYAIEHLFSFDENFQRYNFVDSLLRTADTLVIKKFRRKLDYLRTKDNTSEGKPFINIPGTVAVYSDEHWVETDGTLKDIINGKLAVVNFWSTGCFFCSQEIRGTLVPLYNKYKDSGLVVVGVDSWDNPRVFIQALGNGSTLSWGNDYFDDIAKMHVGYPQLKADFVDAALIYGLEDIPETILIAPDGTILARDLRSDYIEEAVVNALKKEK